MKKIALVSLLAFLFVAWCPKVAAASQGDEKVTVNASDLTVDQLAKIKAEAEIKELQKKLDTYGNWVGVGGEIGKGIKEGLSAVVDVADKFGNTKVGTFTMVMVAWKIIGKDLVRIFLGIIFALIVTIFLFRSYRTSFMVHRVCTKPTGWQFWLPKEYKIVEPDHYEGFELVKIIYLACLVGSYGITYAIMFG